MKQIFLSCIFFIFMTAIKCQTITPSIDNEYCPNTEYTFTVTIPKSYSSMIGIGGCYITQLPSPPVGSTFTFKGKFGDANQKQIFKINYTDGSSYSAEFKRIKSLFYSTACSQIQAPLTVTAPLCEISNIPISFSAVKWGTSFETPELCFGSISTYEYQLPVGWSIGSNVSTGSNWIPGGTNVTVTSDASTGNGDYIQVRPKTSCGAGLSNNQTPAAIHILRPEPTFTISPSFLQIQCTSTPTQTFSVNTTGAITCPISYNWDLGTGNHWLLNGTSAPATFTTATNSIILTSQSYNTLPSAVKVTPVLNGINQPQLTSPVSWTQPNYGLIGGSNICTGTSQPFYVYNTTGGSSYAWGSVTTEPNYGASVIQINSPYSNQTTLTKIGDGVVQLSVQVTNVCQQINVLKRDNVRVGGYSETSGTLSGYMLAYPPCNTEGCTPSAVSSSITTGGPNGTVVYGGATYMGCQNDLQLYNTELEGGTWSLISGSVVNWWSNIGTHLSFIPGGPAGSTIKFRLTKNNSCGNQYYDFYFSPTYYSYSQYSLYTISPNPATSTLSVAVDEEKLSQDKIIKSNSQDIKEISILDKMGTLIRKQAFGKNIRKANLSISNLKAGVYILKIFNGKDFTSLKFIKE
jgi:hypothetical protein